MDMGWFVETLEYPRTSGFGDRRERCCSHMKNLPTLVLGKDRVHGFVEKDCEFDVPLVGVCHDANGSRCGL